MAVQSGEKTGYELAPELAGGLVAGVHPHDDFRGVELLEGVLYAVDDVRRNPHLGLHHHPGVVGHLRDVLKQAPATLLVLQPVDVVVDHGERDDAAVQHPVAHQEGKADQVVGGRRVLQRHKDFLVVAGFFFRHGSLVLERDVLRGALGHERAEDAGHENEQHRAVEHVVVEQPLAVGKYEVVAHHDGCKRCAGLCVAKAIYEFALYAAHPKELLGAERGHPLAHKSHHYHDGGHLQGTESAEKQLDVDEHTHADEEIRYEDGVAHELEMGHQGRHVGHVAVEHKARKERPEEALHADKLHQPSAEEGHGEHEDELRNGVVVTVEEEACHARKEVNDDEEHCGDFQEQHDPEAARYFALEHPAHDGEHEQRQRVGDGGRPDGYGDAALAGKAVAHDYWVGDDGVRGVHTGQEHGGHHAVLKHGAVDYEAHQHRYDEGHQPVGERPHAVLHEVGHVHLEAGEEHDVVQADVPEEVERVVLGQDVEPVRADHNPREHHADDVRDAQLAHDDGREQYDT